VVAGDRLALGGGLPRRAIGIKLCDRLLLASVMYPQQVKIFSTSIKNGK